MSNLVEETRNIMKKYGIRANKDLGQNFLINNEVVENIVNSSEISQDDMVIEIGPGLGTLTKYLLEKAGKVLCIELDKKMIEILEDRFEEYSNFEIINDDVLKVDLNKIIKENKENEKIKNVKIVANLPYYITTPIIMKLLEEKLDIESITVMIQKEVADRLIEVPSGKNTGAITYTIYYYCDSEKIMEVPNSSFIPEPEVTSEVIGVRFSILSNLGIEVKGNDDFKWDCVPKDFYKEFIFFYNTVGIQFNNAWYRRFAPEELATISYTKGFDNKYRVRIVRNDNRYVDICVSRHEVREMIFSLEEMIKNHDFEEEIPYGK